MPEEKIYVLTRADADVRALLAFSSGMRWDGCRDSSEEGHPRGAPGYRLIAGGPLSSNFAISNRLGADRYC